MGMLIIITGVWTVGQEINSISIWGQRYIYMGSCSESNNAHRSCSSYEILFILNKSGSCTTSALMVIPIVGWLNLFCFSLVCLLKSVSVYQYLLLVHSNFCKAGNMFDLGSYLDWTLSQFLTKFRLFQDAFVCQTISFACHSIVWQ